MAEDGSGWTATGELAVGVVGRPGGRSKLPEGLKALPGPHIIAAARYASSPVGPYLELAVVQPVRLGLRPAASVTTMVVDSAQSQTSGRERWGYPKELGSLHWSEEGDERSLRWDERGVVMRWTVRPSAVPSLLPFVSLQLRGDGPAWVPGRVRALSHLSRVHVSVPADDPLSGLAGRHRGAHLSDVVLDMGEARPISSHCPSRSG